MPAEDTMAPAASPARFDGSEILDALSTGLLVLDARLRLVYANVGAQDLLALSLRQGQDHTVGELFADPQALIELLQRSLANLEICAGHEFTLTPVSAVQAARPSLLVDITVTPLETARGEQQLLIELVDARARRRISREAELLTRADGSRLMVRQLAHEVRNPLAGLRGAAQLLERELHQEALKEYTTVIMSEADRLRDLVDTMLGPTGPPRKQALNVHEICEHVYQLLRSEAPGGVSIERDYDPSVPEGRFDRNELIQALLNIARNALQALNGSGRLVLRTRALSHLNIGPARHRLVACVQIEDDGPGVPPDLHQTLFFPLVSAKTDGTGLGLSVAQEMVARHGGIIEFESRVGHTVFSILLPLEDAA
ncbi:MAG TPA: nitrogen regulation protein NR(II) [Steroidobacteraceae bacterium]|nr:nitrogen regulation protein NR(II) [Steroidobacteraceae bacterium]